MARVLREYFGTVQMSDAFDYGCGEKRDFLKYPIEPSSVEWIITNPPFRLAEEFVLRAFTIATEGVAILARTVFLESVGRYRNLFERAPPTKFAQFTERVPMLRGRLDRKATTATGYAPVRRASRPCRLSNKRRPASTGYCFPSTLCGPGSLDSRQFPRRNRRPVSRWRYRPRQPPEAGLRNPGPPRA